MIDYTKPVTTADGRPVRILCTDRRGTKFCVIGLLWSEADQKEYTASWTIDGFFSRDKSETDTDLINPVVKKYINIFTDGPSRPMFASREEAEACGNASKNSGYLKTIEVEL